MANKYIMSGGKMSPEKTFTNFGKQIQEMTLNNQEKKTKSFTDDDFVAFKTLIRCVYKSKLKSDDIIRNLECAKKTETYDVELRSCYDELKKEKMFDTLMKMDAKFDLSYLLNIRNLKNNEISLD